MEKESKREREQDTRIGRGKTLWFTNKWNLNSGSFKVKTELRHDAKASCVQMDDKSMSNPPKIVV